MCLEHRRPISVLVSVLVLLIIPDVLVYTAILVLVTVLRVYGEAKLLMLPSCHMILDIYM